jgi:hypothetical protein
MKEVSTAIEYKDKTYKMVFNLNVMEEIQEQYGSLQKWGELTDGKDGSGEPNVKALIFGLTTMLNEGIDIENDETGSNIQPLTKKQVGRILTDFGINKMNEDMNNLVIESTKSDEKNV